MSKGIQYTVRQEHSVDNYCYVLAKIDKAPINLAGVKLGATNTLAYGISGIFWWSYAFVGLIVELF